MAVTKNGALSSSSSRGPARSVSGWSLALTVALFSLGQNTFATSSMALLISWLKWGIVKKNSKMAT